MHESCDYIASKRVDCKINLFDVQWKDILVILILLKAVKISGIHCGANVYTF